MVELDKSLLQLRKKKTRTERWDQEINAKKLPNKLTTRIFANHLKRTFQVSTTANLITDMLIIYQTRKPLKAKIDVNLYMKMGKKKMG